MLPHRTYNAVATRLARITAGVKRGPWTAEEDRELLQRYTMLGPKWADIGRAIGRSGQSCRDRWRVTGLVPGRNIGPWSEAECSTLVKVVTEAVCTPLASVSQNAVHPLNRWALRQTWCRCPCLRLSPSTQHV